MQSAHEIEMLLLEQNKIEALFLWNLWNNVKENEKKTIPRNKKIVFFNPKWKDKNEKKTIQHIL